MSGFSCVWCVLEPPCLPRKTFSLGRYRASPSPSLYLLDASATGADEDNAAEGSESHSPSQQSAWRLLPTMLLPSSCSARRANHVTLVRPHISLTAYVLVDSQVKRNIVRVNATKKGCDGRRGRFSVAFSLPKGVFRSVFGGRKAHPALPVAFPCFLAKKTQPALEALNATLFCV